MYRIALAMKMNEVMLHAKTWVNFANIVLIYHSKFSIWAAKASTTLY